MNELARNIAAMQAVTGALAVRHAVTLSNPDGDRFKSPYKDVVLATYHAVTLEEAYSIQQEFIRNNPDFKEHNLKFRWTSWKDL